MLMKEKCGSRSSESDFSQCDMELLSSTERGSEAESAHNYFSKRKLNSANIRYIRHGSLGMLKIVYSVVALSPFFFT